MSEEVNSVEMESEFEPKHYELGYLLSPLIAADNLAEFVEAQLKKMLTNHGAKIKTADLPRSFHLAYPIKKTVEHKGTTFVQAYFGFCRFSVTPDQLTAIETMLKKVPELIRFLLISVSAKEEVPRAAYRPRVARAVPVPPDGAINETVPVSTEKKKTMTKEAMDKEIEGLLTVAA